MNWRFQMTYVEFTGIYIFSNVFDSDKELV